MLFARNIFLRSHSIEHQNVMLISNQMLFRQYIQTMFEESPPAKILVLANTVLRPTFDSLLLQKQVVSIRHHSNKLVLFRGQ
ncbi:unnamed protein product [Acanthoscelides obtectus]|uniref:Uncharacterized protein n=1 Tax=Acanthoscelides obtectus TaxID=200917 RepID=A0A9P0JPB8_ACAOB|nr:unnamed protein product [Acanthoscelides obtectus]CAK1655081.1 hypothetical protein AOBTE_LOCUS19017 [Acanthoscelides obtectus]